MKNIYILALTSLLFTSCEKNDNLHYEEKGLMHIEVIHPSSSRATETSFEIDDKIGIYATEYSNEKAVPLQISGNWTNNVSAIYDGVNWNSTKKIYWSDNKMDVYGYYPYMQPTSIDEHSWSVQLDQSIESSENEQSGYESSDFLWAKTTAVSKTDEKVELQFSHCCSKIVVKLVKGDDYVGEFPEESELYIHSTVPSATIDFTNGAVTKHPFGEMKTIKARKVDAVTFEAIIVPQRLETTRPFIEYVANGISYLHENTFVFKAKKKHVIELEINSNPEQIEIEINGKVEDWT